MKAFSPLLLLILVAGSVHATDVPSKRKPITPVSNCIRIDRINEWHIVDARTATVRTGPRRYRVDLQSACPRLGQGPAGLVFGMNRSHQALGDSSICGEVGETVRSAHQPPCAIASVKMIDKAEFDRLSAHALRHGSGADQPTGRP